MAHNSPWHSTYAGSLLLSLALHHFLFPLYYMSGSLTPKNMTKLDWLHFALTGNNRFKDVVARDAGFIHYLKRTKRDLSSTGSDIKER